MNRAATSVEAGTQLELDRLIHASARFLDDHDFPAYLDLYKEEGIYTIVTRAPELPEPMIWMQLSAGGIKRAH